jgi:asparagine synthase (glutamine-hydrolysing)
MTSCLAHRGPDGKGTWIDSEVGVALGFRRLAIIDLSDAGAQPMVSASGRFVIAFNGEIFNHLELRDRLQKEGSAPSWRGHSDTEILLACIEAWGLERAISESVGMFGIVLWDRRKRSLSLVRDRAGVKPLYYGTTTRALFFASELKAIERHPQFSRTIDPEAAALYAQYAYVPGPKSIYAGVEKLAPGTIATWSAAEPCQAPLPQHAQYWDAVSVAAQRAATPFQGSDDDATGALQDLLSTSVALRMIADVPLGLFLSGGVDSSIIAALMQQNSTTPIHTFTIGFDDPVHDEARFGRDVARHFNTNHEEHTITSREALELVPLLPSMYDEPFADSSALPTHLVSKLARRTATVALSGDGGDELFGGYSHHFLGALLHRRVSSVPRAVRPVAGRLLQLLPRTRSFANALLEDDPVATYRRGMTQSHRPARLARTDEIEALPLGPIDRMMLHDFTSYLVDDILVKVDRASMATSLEVRTPFLDHRVIEFAWSLPLSTKIRGDRGKWILRKLLLRFLPEPLVDRPKQGFGLPLAQWLRGPLRAWAEELLSGVREPFDAKEVRSLWDRHLRGENHERGLWIALMYEAWRTR